MTSMKQVGMYLGFAAIGIAAFFAVNKLLPSLQNNNNGHIIDPNIQAEAQEIWTDEEALYSYVKKFGPAKTLAYLNELSAKFGSCHDAAHKAGRYAYEILKEESFKECSAECHSGCYHGATEAYFKEHGTANLSENLNTLCGDELNAFFSHQCVHGIGHGLMAWTNYELFDALKSCDLLSKRQDSCWTGVFMENIVGGLAKADIEKNPGEADHFTNYLSDDPLFPCNHPDLEEKYKGACYFLQTSRMTQLFESNFVKVAEACKTAPAKYQNTCFISMGRDIGGTFRSNSEGAISACNSAPKGESRLSCLSGAIQDTFWDKTGQDDGLRFCKLLTDSTEKTSCYDIIFGRAPDILSTKQELNAFCEKTESQYQSICRTKLGI